MKKNSKLHIPIGTDLLEKLRKEASSEEICVAELCRRKLSQNIQLDRIENLVREVLKYERKN